MRKIKNRRQYVKDVRNLFRLKEEIEDITIKHIRNLFRLKKEIDDATVKDIRNLFRLKKRNWSN